MDIYDEINTYDENMPLEVILKNILEKDFVSFINSSISDIRKFPFITSAHFLRYDDRLTSEIYVKFKRTNSNTINNLNIESIRETIRNNIRFIEKKHKESFLIQKIMVTDVNSIMFLIIRNRSYQQ